ncbi:MAG: S-ribosylhomocysteine lyase, partial [Firmicutes bacterium]|nr:S-ribosylhomocysteine lyase [Candidatus Caballimonas caccae]
MEKIESFKINHLTLKSGLYVSRKDYNNGTYATTFVIRLITPYKDEFPNMPELHTIEHLGATFLRNAERKDDIIYFGPMGCQTGFYLVMFGD